MDIALLQKAAKHIEADDMDGLQEAAALVGMPTALAILVAYQRVYYGSLKKGYPPDPMIDVRVSAELSSAVPAVFNFLKEPCALFYTQRWYCFDNFSAFAVEWRGRLWPTVEHAYQAAKFDDPVLVDKVFNARSAHEAKKIGGDPQYRRFVRLDWGRVKRGIMKEILLAKFAQHEYVRKKLRESQGWRPVEDSHHDAEWGRGPDWNGENWLGEIWKEIRDDPATPW